MKWSDKEMRQWIRREFRRSVYDILDELERVKKEVYKMKQRQRRIRQIQRSKKESFITTPSLIDRRFKEIEQLRKQQIELADKSR